MVMRDYDFRGWATRNDVRCSDGRTIRRNAFVDCDGKTVPLVWNHDHNDPMNVLGHAMLENRNEGVYTYAKFNDTEAGRNAKELVKHGDVTALSIYANRLKQNGGDVVHGVIREVSLVLAGANPKAYIENVMSHGDENGEEVIIYTGEDFELGHSDEQPTEVVEEPVVEHAEESEKESKKMAEEKTVKDVFDTLNEEQKTVVYALIGQALEDAKGNKSEGDEEDVKHNVFDNDYEEVDVLSHSEMAAVFSDAKRLGSMKEAALQHGIEDIEILFPEAKNVNGVAPEFIKRDMGWVDVVMNGTSHSPFSRIKTVFADITEDEARAKGYLADHTHRNEWGNLVDATGRPAYKKEEVFSLLKRSTTPTTIYKKQKLDRDDVIDITDFDVIAWIKGEMRMMLNEEIARAVLVGDGRLSSDDDKINEQNIRPIWKDEDLFVVRKTVVVGSSDTADTKAKAAIRAAIKARKDYRGSGNPVCFMTEDLLTDMLLLEDGIGHLLYDTEEKLRTALRCSKIVTVPVMENQVRQDAKAGNVDKTLGMIFVNLSDYKIGADKGGNVNMFDDFDIDYNAMKYLMETRISGALIKPYSAIVVEFADEER